jgi:FG-GAP-like repeat/EF hand
VGGNLDVVEAADLDGDGHPDLAVSAGGSLLVLLGKGDGSFAPARRASGVPSAAALAAADLDGDGRIDLVVAHGGEQVSTVLLNAGGAFRPAWTVPSSGKLRVADLDEDGIADLVVLGDALVIYRGKGDGTFEVARAYGFGGSDVAVADVDGDGRLDIVLPAGNRSPFVSVLPNASR